MNKTVFNQIKTEIIAGITTFMTMSYILFVNAQILSDCGMDKTAVMMATALSSAVATIFMGLYTNYPFALAPGMGLNAYFAYSVCKSMGLSWEVALGAVFLDGVLFLIISILPIREKIFKEIPLSIKLAVSSGIGLFIAFIGLQHAGIVVSSESTMLQLGNIKSVSVMLAIIGLFFAGVLMVKKFKGALLYSIFLITILGIFVKHPDGTPITVLPTKLIAIPSFEIFSKTFLKLKILDSLSLGLITIIFTFTFVDMFDTIGTVVGLATKLNIIQPNGSFPKAGRVLVCDAVGTIFGALCGTSTVTNYIESAAGISEGGKTGLTSIVVGILFLLSLLLWPIATCIPKEATAPALIIVGYLMIEPILRVNFSDITEGLPAFITLILMPLTYSIANGLIFGILSYVVIKILSGKAQQVSLTMLIISAVFLIYFLVK